MTITTSSPPATQAKPQSKKGATLFEILIVFFFIGTLWAIIVPNVLQKQKKADVIEAKNTVLNLLKIAQSSAVIENNTLDLKQKVRLLIHIDPTYKEQYCACMMLIQGERTKWKVLQPIIKLPPGVFFVLLPEKFIQTMDFDPVQLADYQGPTWLYYEFDSKGHYTGLMNRICLSEGVLEEKEEKAHIVYDKNQDNTCIYIHPTGFAHDV